MKIQEVLPKDVSDEVIDAISDRVGYYPGAWDVAGAPAIVAESINVGAKHGLVKPAKKPVSQLDLSERVHDAVTGWIGVAVGVAISGIVGFWVVSLAYGAFIGK